MKWLGWQGFFNVRVATQSHIYRTKHEQALPPLWNCKEPCKALMNRLDTFQLKGLRNILGMTTTFVNRANSNAAVFQNANAAKNASNSKHAQGKHFKPFSQYNIKDKQWSLLAHTIRADNTDPLRQCTLQPDTAIPSWTNHKRVGRPRGKWALDQLQQWHVKMGYGNKEHFRANFINACDRICTTVRRRKA